MNFVEKKPGLHLSLLVKEIFELSRVVSSHSDWIIISPSLLFCGSFSDFLSVFYEANNWNWKGKKEERKRDSKKKTML